MIVSNGDITIVSVAETPNVIVSIGAPDTTLVSIQESQISIVPLGRGVQGPPGPAGASGASTGIYIADNAILIGQPVRISRATGKAGPANASVYSDSFIMGFAAASASAGFSVQLTFGLFTLPDWTAIAGQALLLPGVPYFLRTGGGITTATPDRMTYAASVFVGVAVSQTVFFIDPKTPMML